MCANLRAEHILRVLDNKLMSKIFGQKKREATGGLEKMT
jgi:hypothetical protein